MRDVQIFSCQTLASGRGISIMAWPGLTLLRDIAWQSWRSKWTVFPEGREFLEEKTKVGRCAGGRGSSASTGLKGWLESLPERRSLSNPTTGDPGKHYKKN